MAGWYARRIHDADVAKAVVMSVLPDSQYTRDFIVAANGHVHALCYVDPRDPHAPALLEREMAAGFRGVKLLPVNRCYRLSDPACRPFFEKAAELGREHDHPLRRDRRSHRRPALRRPARPVSGGARLPRPHASSSRTSAPGWLDEVLRLAYQCKNVCVDTSGTNNWMDYDVPKLTLAEVFERCLMALGPERVLFGTDAGTTAPYRTWIKFQQTRVLEELGLSDGDRDLILRGNAVAHLPARRGAAVRTCVSDAERDSEIAPQATTTGSSIGTSGSSARPRSSAACSTHVGARRSSTSGAGTRSTRIMFASGGSTWSRSTRRSCSPRPQQRRARRERDRRAGGSVRLVEGGFGELQRSGSDRPTRVTCTGNALPHVDGLEGLRVALATSPRCCVPGGVLVLHLLNHAGSSPSVRAPSRRSCARRRTGRGSSCACSTTRRPARYRFDFLTLNRPVGGVGVSPLGAPTTRRCRRSLLRAELRGRSASRRVELLGGHDGHALTDADESVIVLARRAAG